MGTVHRNAAALEVRAQLLFERARTLCCLSSPEVEPTATRAGPLGPTCTIGGRDLLLGEEILVRGADESGVESGGLAAIDARSVTLACRDATRVVRLP